MKKNKVLKKHFHFTNKSEIIHFTPITEIFDQFEIDLIESWRFREHECHKNSMLTALMFNCEYCEGLISNGTIEHAFNKIERHGQTFFFDVTEYILRKNPFHVKPWDEALLLRLFSKDRITEVHLFFDLHFVTLSLANHKDLGLITIDNDGYVKDNAEIWTNLSIRRKELYDNLSSNN